MKIPFSLKYIRTTFLDALEKINAKLLASIKQPHQLQLAKHPAKSRGQRPLPTKRPQNGKTSRAKGRRHSEQTFYNHPRKDQESHDKH